MAKFGLLPEPTDESWQKWAYRLLAVLRPIFTKVPNTGEAGEDGDTIIQFQISPGFCWLYSGTGTPQGWLECLGQTVEIGQYPDLYAAIGTIWADGDEPTGQFRLPPGQRALVGAGTTEPGVPTRSLGDKFGQQLTSSTVSKHTHQYIDTVPVFEADTAVLRADCSGSLVGPVTGVTKNNVATGNSSVGSTNVNADQPSAVFRLLIKT